MKKLRVIAVVLFVLMLFNATVFTANAEVDKSDVSVNYYGLLNSIGVLKTEDNLSDNDLINRSQFALYAYRLIGESKTAESHQYFTDVNKGDLCFEAVSELVQRNVLSVGDDRMFMPEQVISYEEACKILIHLLGYEDLALMRGGYPTGYIKAATRVDLSAGVSTGKMTYKNVIRLLYNATQVKVTDVAKIGKDGYITKEETNDTLLSLYHNIYKAEGIVEKNSVASVVDNSVCRKDEVCVGGVVMEVVGSDLETFLGVEVAAYYQKDSSENINTLVYYYKNIEKSTIIDAENLSGYNKGTIYFCDESGEHSISIGTEAVIIKNGLPVQKDETGAFDIKNGYIDVTRNKNGTFAAHIFEAETWVVKYTDVGNQIIYDKYRLDEKIDCLSKDIAMLKIYDVTTNSNVPFEYISPGQVLTVYRSENDEILKIYASNKTVRGTANEVSKDHKISIDGKEYKVNRDVEKYINIPVGISATFALDINEKVCACLPNADQTLYGYLYAITNPDGFGNVLMKIFTIDGAHKIFALADNVVVDGEKIVGNGKSVEKRLASTGDMGTIKQLIRYTMDSNGEIKKIDTAARNESERERADTLWKTVPYDGATTHYYYTSNSDKGCFFFPRPTMYRDTLVFVVPDESEQDAKESRYMVTDKSYFNKGDDYKISAYKTDATHPYAEVIVVRTNSVSSITDANKIFLVSEVGQSINKEESVCTMVTGLQQRVSMDLCFADDAIAPAGLSESDINKGDVIRYALNQEGDICQWEKVFDYKTRKPVGWEKTKYSPNSQLHLIYANVIDKYINNDYRFDFDTDKPMDILYLGYDDTETVSREFRITMANSLVEVYDTKTDKIYIGDANDIIGYKNDPNGSSVLIHDAYGITSVVIVYK